MGPCVATELRQQAIVGRTQGAASGPHQGMCGHLTEIAASVALIGEEAVWPEPEAGEVPGPILDAHTPRTEHCGLFGNEGGVGVLQGGWNPLEVMGGPP